MKNATFPDFPLNFCFSCLCARRQTFQELKGTRSERWGDGIKAMGNKPLKNPWGPFLAILLKYVVLLKFLFCKGPVGLGNR